MLGLGGFSGGIALDGNLIYGAGGAIIDPTTPLPTQLGVLPLGAGPYNSGLYGGGTIPYGAERKSFNVGVNAAGTWLVFLERFDTEHYALEDQIQFPTTNLLQTAPGTRWGQDGLAYLLGTGLAGNAPAQIFIMRGPFVLPAEGAVHAAPTLSAAGTGKIAAGSGNQRLTVTGTGFLPGASVVWSGTVHDTTYVDAQHLSVAVAAPEVAAAATVSVTCRNPGSIDSNVVTFQVQ